MTEERVIDFNSGQKMRTLPHNTESVRFSTLSEEKSHIVPINQPGVTDTNIPRKADF
jgi:hypothetical protein